MTIAQFIALVEARIGAREYTNIEAEEVEAFVSTALQRATEQIAESVHASDVQRTATVALTAGVGDLPDDFLPGYVSRVHHAAYTHDFTLYQEKRDLLWHYASEFGAVAIEGLALHTVTPDGGEPITGDIEVTGIYVPAIGSWPSKHEGVLIDQAVELAQERWKINKPGRDMKTRIQAA